MRRRRTPKFERISGVRFALPFTGAAVSVISGISDFSIFSLTTSFARAYFAIEAWDWDFEIIKNH